MPGMTHPDYPYTVGSSGRPVKVASVEEMIERLRVNTVNLQLFRSGHFDGTRVVPETPITIFEPSDFVEQDKLPQLLAGNGHAVVSELELFLLLEEHPELKDRYPLLLAMGQPFPAARLGGSARFANVFHNDWLGVSGFGLLEVGESRHGECFVVKPLGS